MSKKKQEHLLDVMPSKNRNGSYFVYDLTYYLNHSWGRDRKKYMERVAHSIEGTEHIVHIIDWWECLTYEYAKEIAIRHIKGDYDIHRLD